MGFARRKMRESCAKMTVTGHRLAFSGLTYCRKRKNKKKPIRERERVAMFGK